MSGLDSQMLKDSNWPNSVLITIVWRELKKTAIDLISIDADTLTNTLLKHPNFSSYQPDLLKKAVLCVQELDKEDLFNNPDQLEESLLTIRRKVTQSLSNLE